MGGEGGSRERGVCWRARLPFGARASARSQRAGGRGGPGAGAGGASGRNGTALALLSLLAFSSLRARASPHASISFPSSRSFCYHQRLSVAGNCRMCLVEVRGNWRWGMGDGGGWNDGEGRGERGAGGEGCHGVVGGEGGRSRCHFPACFGCRPARFASPRFLLSSSFRPSPFLSAVFYFPPFALSFSSSRLSSPRVGLLTLLLVLLLFFFCVVSRCRLRRLPSWLLRATSLPAMAWL